MVKFLKLILALVVIAFAFALGVKFSDSFKGMNRDGVLFEEKMDDKVENLEITNESSMMPEMLPADQTVEGIEVDGVTSESQPMDGIIEPTVDGFQQPTLMEDGMANEQQAPMNNEQPVQPSSPSAAPTVNTQPKTVQPATTNTTVNKK